MTNKYGWGPDENAEVYDPTAEQPNDVVDEIYNEEEQLETQQKVVSEALKRIEQAKLYETLLNHQLFGPRSARPEILAIVENEIRAFVTERLEILVGLKAEKSKHVVQHVESPFNEDEVQALKALASRVLKRDTQQTVASNPQIIPVQTQQEQRPTAPMLNQVPEPREQVNSKPRGRPVQQPAPVKPAKPKKESAKPKMAVGEGYKPMPSMVAQNQAIAASADKINAASSNGEVGKIMSMLASAAIANNKNVQEE